MRRHLHKLRIELANGWMPSEARNAVDCTALPIFGSHYLANRPGSLHPVDFPKTGGRQTLMLNAV